MDRFEELANVLAKDWPIEGINKHPQLGQVYRLASGTVTIQSLLHKGYPLRDPMTAYVYRNERLGLIEFDLAYASMSLVYDPKNHALETIEAGFGRRAGRIERIADVWVLVEFNPTSAHEW